MLVHESAMLLLGHLQGVECLSIYEHQLGVNRFVVRLSFERDIFDTDEVDLERVEFLAIKLIQQRLLRGD